MLTAKPAATGRVPAVAHALLEASAERRFDTQNPGAPLPLRAGVEAEDAIAVVGPEVGHFPTCPDPRLKVRSDRFHTPPALKPI